MSKESFLTISNLDPKESIVRRNDFEIENIRTKEEYRKDWMHLVTHILAIIIILTFLFLLSLILL